MSLEDFIQQEYAKHAHAIRSIKLKRARKRTLLAGGILSAALLLGTGINSAVQYVQEKTHQTGAATETATQTAATGTSFKTIATIHAPRMEDFIFNEYLLAASMHDGHNSHMMRGYALPNATSMDSSKVTYFPTQLTDNGLFLYWFKYDQIVQSDRTTMKKIKMVSPGGFISGLAANKHHVFAKQGWIDEQGTNHTCMLIYTPDLQFVKYIPMKTEHWQRAFADENYYVTLRVPHGSERPCITDWMDVYSLPNFTLVFSDSITHAQTPNSISAVSRIDMSDKYLLFYSHDRAKVYDKETFKQVTTIPYKIHSAAIGNEFLYLSTTEPKGWLIDLKTNETTLVLSDTDPHYISLGHDRYARFKGDTLGYYNATSENLTLAKIEKNTHATSK